MALFNEFKGIRNFHEGLPVSDYRNVFPMGGTVIDRVGEKILDQQNGHPRGKFVDSLGNIYVVVDRYVNVYTYNNGTLTAKGRVTCRAGTDLKLLNKQVRCTFCESSTKPSQVYLCDGRFVYWWNTTAQNDSLIKTALCADMMIAPGVVPSYVKQLIPDSTITNINNNYQEIVKEYTTVGSQIYADRMSLNAYQRRLAAAYETISIGDGEWYEKFDTEDRSAKYYIEYMNKKIVEWIIDSGRTPIATPVLYPDMTKLVEKDHVEGHAIGYIGQPIATLGMDEIVTNTDYHDDKHWFANNIPAWDSHVIHWGFDDKYHSGADNWYRIRIKPFSIKVLANGYTQATVDHLKRKIATLTATINSEVSANQTRYNQLMAYQKQMSTNTIAQISGDALTQIQNNIDIYKYYQNPADVPEAEDLGIGWIFDEAVNVDSICWFDNRLVAMQGDKNTVWISSTNPNQYRRTVGGQQEYMRYSYYNLAQDMFDPNDSDTTSVENAVTASNNLWTYWVSSTNGADRLRQVIGFGGNLYFLNQNSIEPWSATGIENDPIQSSPQNIIHFGGRSGVILDNELYLVANDQMNNVFIAKIGGGQLTKVSNSEVEHRLPREISMLSLVSVRDDTYILVHSEKHMIPYDWQYSGEAYGVTQEGYWFRWENPANDEFAVESIISDIAISNKGSVIQFTDNTRSLNSGFPITRSIRDWFLTFTGRRIVRSVELVMDTGKKIDTITNPLGHHTDGTDYVRGDREQDTVWCAVCFDRGLAFGPHRIRKLGRSNNNDYVVIWRNLGSGNNFAIEFGTSANYKFQLYQVDIQVQ